MISMCSHSTFITFTIIVFYTFLYLPFLCIKTTLLRVVCGRSDAEDAEDNETFSDLPVARFDELEHKEAETCSICLMEFENDDSVSQLEACRHVFHAGCIQSWLDRDRFTCPLCRSSVKHSSHNNLSCKRSLLPHSVVSS